MAFLFNEIIYKPIYNLLIFVYSVIPFHDFGVAIILVTIFIKLVLIPLSKKQIESQKKMQELQPKIKELQAKYKNDKEKQSRALMELYKEKKTNPFSGCLPMIVQLVFLIAIYRVLFNISNAGLKVDTADLYGFVPDPGQIHHMFLGIIDLASVLNLGNLTIASLPQIILVVLAAGSQYVQTKMLMGKQTPVPAGKDADFSQVMSKQMLYLGPLLTLFIGIKFPAGLALYWLVSTVFMIAQQYLLEKKELPEAKKAN
jgi:YidC/Oxa1 family membrane protein insertase